MPESLHMMVHSMTTEVPGKAIKETLLYFNGLTTKPHLRGLKLPAVTLTAKVTILHPTTCLSGVDKDNFLHLRWRTLSKLSIIFADILSRVHGNL
jgi:hypothetical protein